MKNTKSEAMKLLAILAMASIPTFAQSTVEKGKATANDVKREMKKGAHHVEEDLCMGTKAECAAKKVKNRTTEAKDAVVDEAKEVKDKVDADAK